MRTIDGNGKDVILTGETFDLNNSIFTSDNVTAYDLALKYRKQVTAKVNDQYVGWGSVPDFIRYKSRQEYTKEISEITFWHDREDGEFCRFHIMMLVAFGGRETREFGTGRLSEDDNHKHYTQIRGRNLPKSKIQDIKFKCLYNENKK